MEIEGVHLLSPLGMVWMKQSVTGIGSVNKLASFEVEFEA